MSILPKSIKNITIPKMIPVIQNFDDQKVSNVYDATVLELENEKIAKSIKPGSSVAVLVGSRGISDLKHAVKATIDKLISWDAHPFIVPSMGSHGGGIAEEQKKIIENYGITETYMGVPIKASMETIIVGETTSGIPVHIDKIASSADFIVPVVRIKTHTDFDGPIESGFCKMLAIGLGNHNGCSRLHQEGFSEFHKLIPEVASVILGNKSIPFAVSIIENAHENVHTISVVPGNDILNVEPELLKLSKSLMPKLQFDHIDVLIIEKIGKDITGAGMDPNITGRTTSGIAPGFTGPSITRIVLLDLTDETHNNAVGLGLADFITQKMYDKIDPISTNAIASGNPSCAKIPIIMDNEKDAILAAIQTCPQIDVNDAKIVKIRDTLHLINIEISENLLPYCSNNNNFIISDIC
jgi:hypothetical protein